MHKRSFIIFYFVSCGDNRMVVNVSVSLQYLVSLLFSNLFFRVFRNDQGSNASGASSMVRLDAPVHIGAKVEEGEKDVSLKNYYVINPLTPGIVF